MRDLEDATLAFDLVELVFVAAIGHVFAEDHDARIARHLVPQAGVDLVHHGPWLAVEFRRVVELVGSRVRGRRVKVEHHLLGLGGLGAQSFVRGLANLEVHGRFELLQFFLRSQALGDKVAGHAGQRVALGLRLAHFVGFVEPFVVGK